MKNSIRKNGTSVSEFKCVSIPLLNSMDFGLEMCCQTKHTFFLNCMLPKQWTNICMSSALERIQMLFCVLQSIVYYSKFANQKKNQQQKFE